MRNSASRPRRRSDAPRPKGLHRILDELGIAKWDALLIGDGSGQGWTTGCGWSAVLIDNQSKARKLFYGGTNTGTVNIGEVMAYVHAMLWYADNIGKQRLKENNHQPLQIHILTDSQTVVNWGERARRRDEGLARRALWAAMTDMSRQGYQFHYHWIARMSCQLNWAADQLAGASRIALQDVSLTPRGPHVPDPLSEYDLDRLAPPE